MAKSSFSNPSGNCIHVDELNGKIVIWESDQNPPTRVVTSHANFEAFIRGVRAGEFDHFVRSEEMSV